MAVLKHFDPDWDSYYEYHAIPFREGQTNLQAVQIGLNPKSSSSQFDFSGAHIRPRRFNSRGNPNGWPNDEPFDTLDHLNVWNNGWWPGYAITPQHVVVCGHFIKPLSTSPNTPQETAWSGEGPWPWQTRGERKLAFMNSDGEYSVHEWEFADEDESWKQGTSTILLGGDVVLLKLTTPILPDSGIKIYNTAPILDNDQQFATIAVLDPQGRTYYGGFGSLTVPKENPEWPSQFGYMDINLPIMVEEKKLPGGELENEPRKYAGTNTRGSDHVGDSGSIAWIHSKTKGSLPWNSPGGLNQSGGIKGPWAKERVEAFQEYLVDFNAENGTNYTFVFDVIDDAITDIMVPPLINPSVCRTQEIMLSRKLVCEITATGANGEVITKRSESLLEQGIILPPAFNPEGAGVVNSETGEKNIATGKPLILKIPTNDPSRPSYDPLCPFIEGSVTLTDETNKSLVLPIRSKSSSTSWWDLDRFTDEFEIPETWQRGDITAEVEASNKNGIGTFTDTLTLVDSAVPSVTSVILTPVVGDSTIAGRVEMMISSDEVVSVQCLFWARQESDAEGSGQVVGFLSVTIPQDTSEPFITDIFKSQCSTTEGLNVYVEGQVRTKTGSLLQIGAGVPGGENSPEGIVPAIFVYTIDTNTCLT